MSTAQLRDAQEEIVAMKHQLQELTSVSQDEIVVLNEQLKELTSVSQGEIVALKQQLKAKTLVSFLLAPPISFTVWHNEYCCHWEVLEGADSNNYLDIDADGTVTFLKVRSNQLTLYSYIVMLPPLFFRMGCTIFLSYVTLLTPKIAVIAVIIRLK